MSSILYSFPKHFSTELSNLEQNDTCHMLYISNIMYDFPFQNFTAKGFSWNFSDWKIDKKDMLHIPNPIRSKNLQFSFILISVYVWVGKKNDLKILVLNSIME